MKLNSKVNFEINKITNDIIMTITSDNQIVYYEKVTDDVLDICKKYQDKQLKLHDRWEALKRGIDQ